MMKRGEYKRDLKSRNYTIVTAIRHRQTKAPIMLSNKHDLSVLLKTNVIIFINKKNASINYKHKVTIVPCFFANLPRIQNEKKKPIY